MDRDSFGPEYDETALAQAGALNEHTQTGPKPNPAPSQGRAGHTDQMELFGGIAPIEHGGAATIRPVAGGPHNADQTLTYRPFPGFAGTDQFDYTLTDDAGALFSATVTVSVTIESRRSRSMLPADFESEPPEAPQAAASLPNELAGPYDRPFARPMPDRAVAQIMGK